MLIGFAAGSWERPFARPEQGMSGADADRASVRSVGSDSGPAVASGGLSVAKQRLLVEVSGERSAPRAGVAAAARSDAVGRGGGGKPMRCRVLGGDGVGGGVGEPRLTGNLAANETPPLRASRGRGRSRRPHMRPQELKKQKTQVKRLRQGLRLSQEQLDREKSRVGAAPPSVCTRPRTQLTPIARGVATGCGAGEGC